VELDPPSPVGSGGAGKPNDSISTTRLMPLNSPHEYFAQLVAAAQSGAHDDRALPEYWRGVLPRRS